MKTSFMLKILYAIVGVWVVGAQLTGVMISEGQSEDLRNVAPMISAIDIEIVDGWGNETYWVELAKDLMQIQPKTSFSDTLIQKAIESLKQSNKFESIHVDIVNEDEEQKGLILKCVLTPFKLIKDIRFSGLYPLFEKDVLNAMTIFPGDAFIEDSIQEQKELIKKLYQNEGFIDPKVHITYHIDSKDRNYILNVTVEKGDYYRLESLTFAGNSFFSESRLKLHMKTWQSSVLPGMLGRFSSVNLKNDLDTLLELYRSHRFADARIESSVKTNADAKTVSVVVSITEGCRYEIRFEGNKKFWEITLKKDVELFKEDNLNDKGIRKTIDNLISRYRQAGYRNVSVGMKDDIIPEGGINVRIVKFIIDEGPRSIVESVSIIGNESIPSKAIQKQILTRKPSLLHNGAFVIETLKEDLDAIRSVYLERGFTNTHVTEKTVENDTTHQTTVQLLINEGPQTIVSNVFIKGLTVISEQEALKVIRLKPGEPFREYMIKSDENSLASLISQKGYPHVTVTGQVTLSTDLSAADIEYLVDEGNYVKMGEVYYTGNFLTRRKYLDREFKMKRGDPFSLGSLLDSQRNIRNLNVFNSIQFRTIGLKERSDFVNVFVDLEEKKPYYIEAGIGYETSKNFYANAKTGTHNLFGSVKDAWIGGEVSQIGYRVNTGIIEPRLFGTNIQSSFTIFAEQTEEFNQRFGTSIYGASLGFSRKFIELSEKINTGLNFRYEYRNQYWLDSEDIEREEIDDRILLITSPSLTFDSRDSFVNPKKGVFANMAIDISKGINKSLDDFIKYRLDTRYYFTPIKRLTLASAIRIGYISPYGDTNGIPDDQLFFLGGTSDVRGFQENMLRYDRFGKPVGGRQLVSGSIEARVDIGYNLEFTTFYDIGKIEETGESDDDIGFRSSVGAGIRYRTPIGPISFVYGIKLDPQDDEPKGRFHFSIGYTF